MVTTSHTINWTELDLISEIFKQNETLHCDPSILDIDECKGSPCHVNGRCSNNPGSFECECNVGYSGNGFACTGSVQAVNIFCFSIW